MSILRIQPRFLEAGSGKPILAGSWMVCSELILANHVS